ncbi:MULTISPECIES: hypothetical protein [unclassified Corallococcus]|uniref:hypothetical protein n=1 Tax=unclassified Corallococcus TaxID=2685029 RepID=UPI001A8F81DA|nr:MULTISPECIES: hypothetical protein [unclassified Corallococcus]MBN9685900.1 hypothetical protein [Corallococcus sp. NCSPR001]WAS82660.1 hypothetical protein O0N60_25435 [Corallococcus sp. NCRR]
MRDELTKEGADTFWFLTNWEFDSGLIGLAEHQERYNILQWLSMRDPSAGGGQGDDPRGDLRGSADSSRPEEQVERSDSTAVREKAAGAGIQQPAAVARQLDANPPLQLIPPELSERWCFTKNDADFYPSVPHGHLNDKTNPWPKLNPYSGRAFAAKDSEDKRHRLERREMIALWNSRSFRSHALDTIVWYQATYAYHRFPVVNPRRLPRKRRP